MDSNSIGTSNKVGLAVDHGNVILSGQQWGDGGGEVNPESEEDNPCLYGEEHAYTSAYRLLLLYTFYFNIHLKWSFLRQVCWTSVSYRKVQ